MSFINKVKTYKETKTLDVGKQLIEMIKRKMYESIDDNPFNENIIILYDDEFRKEMYEFVVNYFTRKGFFVQKYQKSEYCKMTGMSPGITIGIALSFQKQYNSVLYVKEN